MQRLEKQQQNVEHLFNLIKENPNLRILPLVDTECVPSDDFSSWVAGWGKASIEEILERNGDERIYIKSHDYDDLVDEILISAESEISEEEAEKIVDGYDWEKVIVVSIGLP